MCPGSTVLEVKLLDQRLWIFLRLSKYFSKVVPRMVLTIYNPTGRTQDSFLTVSKLWVVYVF